MSVVWTCVLTCFNCEEHFILNRLSIEKAIAAMSAFPCPHCGAKPRTGGGHRVISLSIASLPFRKATDGAVWHYSEYCSQWPADDFLELDFPPRAEICNECRALVGT
jgi:hypothetical protein